jgi:hypothetical protein
MFHTVPVRSPQSELQARAREAHFMVVCYLLQANRPTRLHILTTQICNHISMK